MSVSSCRHYAPQQRMRLEVFALLRDVVGYCDVAKYDKFELFSTLLDSPCHVERSVVVFDVLIKVFASNSMLENALDVFVNAKRIRLELDIKTCNFLLKCLVKENRVEDVGGEADMRRAAEILGKIYRSGEKLTVVTYKSYIHGLCKVGSVEAALMIVPNLHYKNQPLNSHCFNAVIYRFCKRGGVCEALQVMEEMKSSGVGSLQRSLTLLEDFQEHGFDLNPHSYNAIIYQLCKENYPEGASELLPRMLKRNVLPGGVKYSTLIYGFAKQLNLRKAVKLFTRMVKAGVAFNTATYTILISIFSRSCKMHEAYGIFKEMKERGLRPNQISYTTLIAGFCDAREMNKAWALFEEMSREGCSPNVITRTCLIDGFCKSNRIDWATWVFDKMNRDSVIPDVVTYIVLIAWYQSHGYIDQAHKLYEVMKANGVLPYERLIMF
ncbi:hypothetical protein RJT34_07182 [Clitoria ternatea]|uniref:Pentatricopeptide repeat-containing protein n=1 Tax=Clitoria ternatea TaxID=43366 RepID=A0AAN9K2E2_CLITE